METHTEQLERIKRKLDELRSKDSAKSTFGASKHQYKLNDPITEEKLLHLEKHFQIRLPEDYREFILKMGNGGAGPYYGMESLVEGLYMDLDSREDDDQIDPDKPFPLTEEWNMDLQGLSEEEYEKRKDEEYYDRKYSDGLIRLANYGCGVSMNLVVNGAEYGKVWIDDRCNENGLFPDHYFGNKERIGFLNWYELWLDESLAAFTTSDRRTDS